MQILDSGNRTEFETGAVRDIEEGKGRPSLVPITPFCTFMGLNELATLKYIERYTETGEVSCLRSALTIAVKDIFTDWCTAMLEVSKHFEEGAKKYGDNNWRKGIPTERYVDSMIRHYLKYKRGDKDEPHDRAVIWNIVCCIWTIENHPELNSFAK